LCDLAAIWKELVKTSGGKLILPADINLAEYKTKTGPLGEMPATGGDLLLHIKAETVSLGFEIVKRVSDNSKKGVILVVSWMALRTLLSSLCVWKLQL